MSVTREITVDIEVSLSEFDDDDIKDEAIARGLFDEIFKDIEDMFEAFKLGKVPAALDLAKKIATNHTGKIL